MKIDWSGFDKYPESTCVCRCGAVYRSHAQYIRPVGTAVRKPCPGCGKQDDVISVRGDPETYSLKG